MAEELRKDNFFKFYFDPLKEDEGTLKEYFEKMGIDAEASKKKVLDYLGRKESEIRLRNGSEFKKKYEEEISGISGGESTGEIELQKAGRKSKQERKADEEEKIKMKIIRKLKDEDDRYTGG